MPKVSDEHRESRRQQILDAARACILDHGLEAVSMEMIIARSGLSTGAVYRYFKGKDEIIAAAVSDAMAGILAAIGPVLEAPQPGTPSDLVHNLLSAITTYARSGVGAAAGIDRMPVAIHGWSYVQTTPHLKDLVQDRLRAIRDRTMDIAKQWQADGTIAHDADPDAVAQLIQSICLGFMAQRVLTGEAEVTAHAEALGALRPPAPGTGSSATPATPRGRRGR
jgi:AcrR family transcriptional regulator